MVRPRPRWRDLSSSGIALLVATAGLLLGCTSTAEPPRHLVLITLDTLRADRLGSYGATDIATPHLNRMAEESLLFEAAFSPMPLTLAAHASMLTGLYPREHGVLNHAMVLPQGVETVPERLSENGWETAAFTSVYVLRGPTGISQGFDVFEAPKRSQRPSERVIDQALAWLRDRPSTGRPLFLWVHLFDPHLPYAPSSSSHARLASAEAAKRWPSLDWQQFLEIAQRNGGDIPSEVLAHARDLYDREIEELDAEFGRLMKAVDEILPPEQTTVVVAADHGECFEDGVYFEHADCLSEAAIRVPLWIRFSDSRGSGVRVSSSVSLLDIAPTLLAEAGLEIPEGSADQPLSADISSRDLLVQLPLHLAAPERGRRKRREELIRSVAGDPVRSWVIGHEKVGVLSQGWAYHREEETVEIARLSTPEETNPTPRGGVDEVELGRRLDRLLHRHRASRWVETELSEEMKQALDSLGYL